MNTKDDDYSLAAMAARARETVALMASRRALATVDANTIASSTSSSASLASCVSEDADVENMAPRRSTRAGKAAVADVVKPSVTRRSPTVDTTTVTPDTDAAPATATRARASDRLRKRLAEI